jgi:hypothetical protein
MIWAGATVTESSKMLLCFELFYCQYSKTPPVLYTVFYSTISDPNSHYTSVYTCHPRPCVVAHNCQTYCSLLLRQIAIWVASTCQLVGSFRGCHRGGVSHLKFSSDCELLLSIGMETATGPTLAVRTKLFKKCSLFDRYLFTTLLYSRCARGLWRTVCISTCHNLCRIVYSANTAKQHRACHTVTCICNACICNILRYKCNR